MPMTRTQLRQAKLAAQQQAARLRPPHRARLKRWLEPIRKAFAEMRTGEMLAVKGYPVTSLHTGDDLARIDHCINGFVALINRLFPDFSTAALTSMAKKLELGILLEERDIDACDDLIDEIEERMIKLKLGQLIDAALTEQIALSFELMGETA